MPPFRANLANHRLPLLVPALGMNGPLTGTVRLERGAIVRSFHFERGVLVRSSSTDAREHLAQVLANLGILEVIRAAEAFEQARSEGTPLGVFLVRRRLVDRERLEEALAHKARESLFDCYAWTCGELEVAEELPSTDGAFGLRVPLDTLHRDGLVRLREWKTFREMFPENDATFRVHRHIASEWRSREEERLLDMAESGTTLGMLLAAGREGPLYSARRLLRLYRQGVLTTRAAKGPKAGDALDLVRLVAMVRTLLAEGRYEKAAAVASQALERAAVPEACELYREAEHQMGRAVRDELFGLDGRLTLMPLPELVPPELTADDLYLYSQLKSARTVREAVQRAAMGEVGSWRSVQRLRAAGVLEVQTHGRGIERRG